MCLGGYEDVFGRMCLGGCVWEDMRVCLGGYEDVFRTMCL